MIIAGLMSGTSLDGVDAAILETDGKTITRFGPGLETPFTPDERAVLKAAVEAALAWRFEGPEPEIFTQAEAVLTTSHARAVEAVCAAAGLTPDQLDLIGFHGQTVVHEPPLKGRKGRTRQLGDGAALAAALGAPVAYDFRTADMEAGGQGAPLAPIYHRLLADWSGLERPIGVLNIGGVANITLIGADGTLSAFDTGPGNGLIDAWVEERTGAPMDAGGALAAKGRVLEAGLAELLAHPHFALDGPKSLDRWDFSIDAARNLSTEDGAATLAQFTAEAVALGLARLTDKPGRLIVCGGGRKNADLIARISAACGVPAVPAEAVGWRGDLIEAEAFAVLAARTARGLPISWPATTGVDVAMRGGRVVGV
ncbi:anhydro-N-acetylmuramic acid kinase [Alkalicaulis satelles]|uniref:Anhydro-N-acetylmuramic acid kinase n=1 Tax=Alkalicaulis satelles TaxID=2609175 RepID=A0A5M6ZL18_9PROT|nr:anhydro-N-acetylmuramic acid kinase [Alkalicaulis satelles]KAA5804444.1 anhydro-N-acetylmuramic acid kinase [Alkalicaulis satelles]